MITREDGCETDQFYELCLYTCDTHRCNDNDRSLGPPPTTPPPVGQYSHLQDIKAHSAGEPLVNQVLISRPPVNDWSPHRDV